MGKQSRSQIWTGLMVVIVGAAALALILSGCSETPRATYRPEDARAATIGSFDNIRTYLDAPLGKHGEDAARWMPADAGKAINVLMISGGGAGGAFAVGVLAAWSKAGDRPQFDVVTGVSTGALIAPYAFLGRSYDDRLVRLYTSGIASNLVEMKWMGSGLFGTSLLKAEPLRAMVERGITPTVLAQIAAEHRKGRRLLVLTTDLDTQQAVAWNMGAIADSGRPEALKLFRDVLIASASVPGIYPAVLIKAHAGGHQFEELHSDGGSASQILTLPEELIADAGRLGTKRHQEVNLYVIVNNALMPEFSSTSNRTLPVMARAYSVLIKSQTRSALIALYGYAQRTHAHFHVASIDRQVAYSMADPFNTSYMRAVYMLGYSEMSGGRLWKDRPLFP
jgi:hypothetical protein